MRSQSHRPLSQNRPASFCDSAAYYEVKFCPLSAPSCIEWEPGECLLFHSEGKTVTNTELSECGVDTEPGMELRRSWLIPRSPKGRATKVVLA